MPRLAASPTEFPVKWYDVQVRALYSELSAEPLSDPKHLILQVYKTPEAEMEGPRSAWTWAIYYPTAELITSGTRGNACSAKKKCAEQAHKFYITQTQETADVPAQAMEGQREAVEHPREAEGGGTVPPDGSDSEETPRQD